MLPAAQALRKVMLEDMQINDRHLVVSLDTLAMCTLLDPRYRMRGLAHFPPEQQSK